MSQQKEATRIEVGDRLLGAGGKRIGRVDAVFADYLLVRSGWILPVDLYVPRDAVAITDHGPRVDLNRSDAYLAWHRPLKRVEHD